MVVGRVGDPEAQLAEGVDAPRVELALRIWVYIDGALTRAGACGLRVRERVSAQVRVRMVAVVVMVVVVLVLVVVVVVVAWGAIESCMLDMRVIEENQ